jgi:hypothetical protein
MDDGDASAAADVVECAGSRSARACPACDCSRTCRRETAVTLTLEDGTLVEGVIDRRSKKMAGIVVDYKTDREIATAERNGAPPGGLYVGVGEIARASHWCALCTPSPTGILCWNWPGTCYDLSLIASATYPVRARTL